MWLLRLIVIMFLLSSCSAEKLLQRAYKKDPSLLKQDTILIPEIKIDTFYKFDTVEIKSDLDSILDSIDMLDSCPDAKTEIIKEITKYITTNLITDTLYYESYLNNDSVDLHLALKVWQEKGEIKFNSVLLDSKILTKAPITVIKEDSLFNKKQEIIFLIISGIIIILIIWRTLK